MTICPGCGKQNTDSATFCAGCGAKLERQTVQAPPREAPRQSSMAMPPRELTADDLPARFRPLGAWAYFGYNLLFSIPLAGFIILIVFACGGAKNVNLRSYARSFFCVYLLAAIIIVIAVVAAGGFSALFYSLGIF